MTDRNHRRQNPAQVNQRFPGNKPWSEQAPRISLTRSFDRALKGWGHPSTLADRNCGGCCRNDFSDGRTGMGPAVRRAKQRARSLLRFHENQATRRLARAADPSGDEHG